MKITVKEFSRSQSLRPVIVHSIDMVGYQAMVIVDEKQYLLVKPNGRPLRYSSLMQMREKLSTLPTSSVELSHQSAYDEMINQPVKSTNNTLKVALANSTPHL